MAPWSSRAVLGAGALGRESCLAGQEAGSRAAPSFSAHTEIYRLDLMPVGWYQRCGMGGLRERLSPTAWTSVLLLRAQCEGRAGCPWKELSFPLLYLPRAVVQFLCCPQGQSELQEPVQLAK